MPSPANPVRRLTKPDKLFLSVILLYFTALGYFVLSGTYLFSDEAYMLWNNHNGNLVFNIFNSQGRGLTGLLMEFLFRAFDTAEKLKIIRIFSLTGWLITVCYIFWKLKQFISAGLLQLEMPLVYILCFFIAASLSVAVYIAWAACAEIFIAALAAAYSGFSLFGYLQPRQGHIHVPRSVYLKVAGAGIASLFLYQSLFPLMLFPFFLLLLSGVGQERRRKIYVALIFHAAIYLAYFVCYKSLLSITHEAESTRTGLSNAPLQKLGFFFSFPLNQAFNLNHLFDARKLADQLVFPLAGMTWTVLVFIQPGRSVAQKLKYIAGIIFFWVLAFLPQLISRENFGPYRTMLPLSTTVFSTLAAAVFPLFGGKKAKQAVAFCIGSILLATGIFNYYCFIFKPLSFEYAALTSYMNMRYTIPLNRIVIVRPPENGFEAVLGIRNYKDEFGMPSMSKDWVPEPLVKQVLMEKKGLGKNELSLLPCVQFPPGVPINPNDSTEAGTMVIDVPAVTRDYRSAHKK